MSRIKQLTFAGFVCLLVSAFALPSFAGPGTGSDCCQLTITTCPSDDAVLQADANCSVVVPDYREQIGYNAFSCGSVTVTQSPEAGSTVSTCGSLTINFTISACVICDPETQTECTPFSDTCQLVLQVAPPAVTCPESLQATVEADQTCSAEVPDLTSQLGIPDCLANGCNLLVQQTPAVGTAVGLEGTEVSVVVRLCQGDQSPDECQILATCHGHVTVVQPGITCPESQESSIQVGQNCHGVIPDLTGEVGVPECLNTETCTTVVTQVPEAGTSVGIGFTTVTVTVQQCCDVPEQAPQCTTLSTCQFFINFTPPALTCPESPQHLNADSNCQAIVPDLTGEVGVPECLLTEKEGLLELRKTQTPEAGTTIGIGETQVTVHVELCHVQSGPPAIVVGVECLQVGDCTVTLVVEDKTAPVIVNCPGDVTILADSDCLGQIPDLTVPSVLAVVEATDNCTSQPAIELTQDPPAGTPIGVGTTTLTVTATDEAGNSSDCSVTVILDSNGCQSPGPEPIPEPGPAPQPAPCDPSDSSLNLLFSLLFHAPVCGAGCPLMVMMTICAIVAFKVGSRRSRRR